MKGICFKEDLFHKVVNGSKTQTRRIIFPNTDYTFWSQPTFEGMETDPTDCFKLDKNGEMICDKDGEPKLVTFKGTYGLFEGDQFYFDNSYVRSRYQPGDFLYLKEPFFVWEPEHCSGPSKRFCYKYGIDKDTDLFRQFHYERGYTQYKWQNKLFMPERAARHLIQITKVEIQHLQDITNEDAWCEGVSDSPEYNCVAMFQNKWITIHGFDSWPSNPWVWKYTFQRAVITEGIIGHILNTK